MASQPRFGSGNGNSQIQIAWRRKSAAGRAEEGRKEPGATAQPKREAQTMLPTWEWGLSLASRNMRETGETAR